MRLRIFTEVGLEESEGGVANRHKNISYPRMRGMMAAQIVTFVFRTAVVRPYSCGHVVAATTGPSVLPWPSIPARGPRMEECCWGHWHVHRLAFRSGPLLQASHFCRMPGLLGGGRAFFCVRFCVWEAACGAGPVRALKGGVSFERAVVAPAAAGLCPGGCATPQLARRRPDGLIVGGGP